MRAHVHTHTHTHLHLHRMFFQCYVNDVTTGCGADIIQTQSDASAESYSACPGVWSNRHETVFVLTYFQNES